MTSGQLLVIALASALGATVKSVTGLGYPLLAVPLIAIAIGVEDAVVVVAVPNLAANVYLCWESRDARGDTRDLGRLIGFGMAGAVVGTLLLVRVPEEWLLIGLALTIGVFILNFLRRPELQMDRSVARRWSPVAGAVAGLMQGAVGVSGPVVATWLHGYRLPVRAYIHSVTIIFGTTGAVQLAILLGQGRMTVDRAVGAGVASVAVAVCRPLGIRLRGRLAGPTFDWVLLAVLSASAVSLVIDAVS